MKNTTRTERLYFPDFEEQSSLARLITTGKERSLFFPVVRSSPPNIKSQERDCRSSKKSAKEKEGFVLFASLQTLLGKQASEIKNCFLNTPTWQ